ncbi:MAG: glycosyltransferase family 2 protein [Chitinophagales bacterium]
MIENPSVAVVILNYNGKHWLEQFLPNVIQHSDAPNVSIYVADNASTDDSVAYLKQTFPIINIVQNPINTGYAGGYNDALKKIESDYYVLLNSDVEVTSNWINTVIDEMKKDESIAASQPKILSYHEKNKFEYAGAAGGFIDKYGYPFCRGRIFDTCEIDEGQYNQNTEIFWASGACLFIKSKLFHQVGGFDAEFFAHMEEIDLCWRLKNLGYKITYSANSTVYHVGGGTLNKTNARKTFLNFRNNRILLFKNLPTSTLNTIEKTRNFLDFIAWMKAFISGNFEEAKAIKNALNEYQQSKHKWTKKQALAQHNSIETPNKIGIFEGSIVWQYYIKGIKKFSELVMSD